MAEQGTFNPLVVGSNPTRLAEEVRCGESRSPGEFHAGDEPGARPAVAEPVREDRGRARRRPSLSEPRESGAPVAGQGCRHHERGLWRRPGPDQVHRAGVPEHLRLPRDLQPRDRRRLGRHGDARRDQATRDRHHRRIRGRPRSGPGSRLSVDAGSTATDPRTSEALPMLAHRLMRASRTVPRPRAGRASPPRPRSCGCSPGPG